MATSGTTNWTLAISQIVEMAGRRVRPSSAGPMTGEEARNAREALNLVQIDISNRGYPLSLFELKTLSLTASTNQYTLPTDVADIYNLVYRETNADSTTTDIVLERKSIFEYNNIAAKAQEGRSSIYSVDRDRDAAVLYLFPTPDTADSLVYWAVTKPEDADAAQNDVDFNYRWHPCLVAGVAYYMALERSDVPIEKMSMLRQMYNEQIDLALMEDRDRSSTWLIPGAR